MLTKLALTADQRFGMLERQVADAVRYWDEFLPAPVQSPRPRIILGGSAGPRAAALAAAHADEYNLLFHTPEAVREKRALLDDRLALSMMTAIAAGTTRAEADERLARIGDRMGAAGGDS